MAKSRKDLQNRKTHELLNLASSLTEFIYDYTLLGQLPWDLQEKLHFSKGIATFYLNFERRR